jgi:hypothetical protein
MQKFTSLTVQMTYVAITGISLIFMPNTLLGLFDLGSTTEVWIRVLGIIVLTLAILYYGIIKAGNKEVIKFTVYGRLFAASGIILLALLGFSKLTLVLFAGVDIATAIWTWFELKKQ